MRLARQLSLVGVPQITNSASVLEAICLWITH
jgi:hypothetical protein